MNNVIVLKNESMLGEVFQANAELIAKCVHQAVTEAAQLIGPAKFAAAICERHSSEEILKAA